MYTGSAVLAAGIGLCAARHAAHRWGHFGDTWLEARLRVPHRMQVGKVFAHAAVLTLLVVVLVAAGAAAGRYRGQPAPNLPEAVQFGLPQAGAAAGLCAAGVFVWTLLLTGPIRAYPWFGLMRRAHQPFSLEHEPEDGPVAALAYRGADGLTRRSVPGPAERRRRPRPPGGKCHRVVSPTRATGRCPPGGRPCPRLTVRSVPG